ncbi:MAG: DUF1003 domain-containing protein [Parcubacteria group bacterium]
MEQNQNHHQNKLTLGQRAADKVATWIGSWKFILLQSGLLFCWITLNALGILTWDSHPFIFLTLLLGIQAAYSAPIILMSQNRTAERDRYKAEIDLATDRLAEREIKQIHEHLEKIEDEKLRRIIEILEKR